MFTFNGIGTRLYGHAVQPDGSYIATKWAVILFVPIFPLESHRVIIKEPTYGTPLINSTTSYFSQAIPLDHGQVLRTYAVTAAIIGGLAWVIANSH